jgi:hypothetical protein
MPNTVYYKSSKEPNENKVISHHILLNKGANTNVESLLSPIRRRIALIPFKPLPSTTTFNLNLSWPFSHFNTYGHDTYHCFTLHPKLWHKLQIQIVNVTKEHDSKKDHKRKGAINKGLTPRSTLSQPNSLEARFTHFESFIRNMAFQVKLGTLVSEPMKGKSSSFDHNDDWVILVKQNL